MQDDKPVIALSQYLIDSHKATVCLTHEGQNPDFHVETEITLSSVSYFHLYTAKSLVSRTLKLNNIKVATKSEAKKQLQESPTFSIYSCTSYLKLVEVNRTPHRSLLPANHQHISQRSTWIQTTNASGKILQCRMTSRTVFCNRIKHREISIMEKRAGDVK